MRLSRASLRLLGVSFSLLGATLTGCANKTAPSGTATVPGGTSAAPIVVGEYGSLTGSESTFGTSTDQGVQLQMNALNKAGGIDGHPIQVKLEDDEGKPDAALTVVKKLITEDKAIAVLGEVASKNSMAAAPFCNSSKVPMISPSSTNPKVTQIGPYIFRVCFIDPFQGPVEANFAYQNLKARKAAILTDSTSQYSLGLTQFITQSFIKDGGAIVAKPTYVKGDPDFRSQLTTIKAANPDVLFVPGYYSEVGTIARQAREIGLNVPLVGGDGWDSPKLIEGAGGPGGALEGSYFSNHSSMDSPDPAIVKFVADYKAAYGAAKPDALAALGYDAAGVLVDAMKRAGKPADGDYTSEDYRTKLRDAIAATKDYKGVTGTITLNQNRDAVKPVVMLQIKGSDYKFVGNFSP